MPIDANDVTEIVRRWRLYFRQQRFGADPVQLEAMVNDCQVAPNGQKLRWWFEDFLARIEEGRDQPTWLRFRRYLKGRALAREPDLETDFARSRWAQFDAERGRDKPDNGPKLAIDDPRVGAILRRIKAKARRLTGSLRVPEARGREPVPAGGRDVSDCPF